MVYQRHHTKYKPGQVAPFKISRSKIELFTQCSRCFWLDVRLQIKRPSTPPFQINKAIDELFKKEFDTYRAKAEPHPIMIDNQIKAVPFAHKKMDEWRQNFVGVTYLHKPTNLHIFGAIDDIWVNDAGELIIVDYKATSKNKEVTLDAEWQNSYKRQMEIYQWLFRQNDFKVSDTGYFVYANGRSDLDGFYNKVEFKTKLIAHTGKTDWVEPVINDIKRCIDSDELPPMGNSIMGGECEHCIYAKARTQLTVDYLHKKAAAHKK